MAPPSGPAPGIRRSRVAVLASGDGTILEGLLDRSTSGTLPAEFVLVVADRPGAPVLGRARRAGVPTAEVPRPRRTDPAWSEELTGRLRAASAELVLLDGFRSIVPPEFVGRWRGRILNVHPSLLPRHAGLLGPKVHAAVLAAGDPETGATVHQVTEAVDAGPIVAVRRMEVRTSDTPESLRERLRPLEIEACAEAIAAWRPPTGDEGP